jgi:hypothetical protein
MTVPPGPARGCAPAGVRALLANRRATVYARGENVYGCSSSSRRSYLLGASGRTLKAGRAGPLALAGADVAYGLSRFGVDTGTAQVVVRRLTDGVVLREASATTRVPGAESYQSVAALVVKGDGAVAWIGNGRSIIGRRPVVEVHRYDGRGQAELDSGSRIASGSLRLHGSRLTWTNSARRRSATLS